MGRLLVVDDDRPLCELIALILSREGHTVVVAHDGEEGLRKAEEERPDVVLLDLMMEKENGFDVFRKMQRDPKLKDIPVLICSALGWEHLPGPEQKSLEGVRGYIQKPFRPKEVIGAVDELLVASKNGGPKFKVI